MADIKEIGIIKSKFNNPTDPIIMKQYRSYIIINKEFEEGLHNIEDNEYLQILFKLHLTNGFDLKDSSYDNTERGIFASRASNRPNAIGLTTVKLLKKNGRFLYVKGLDALNNSPVLDIKPYCQKLDENYIPVFSLN